MLASLWGGPYHDLRAFAYTFYLLVAVLSVNLIVTALDLVVMRSRPSRSSR
jgi:hypothetical protein